MTRNMTPTLTFVFQRGCAACKLAKPMFEKAVADLDDSVRVERIDAASRKIPYDAAIKSYPAFHLETSCRSGTFCPSPVSEKLTAQLTRWLGQMLGSCPVKTKAKRK